jgi:hypothetical protein
VTVKDILQQLIEKIDRQKPKATAAAQREYEKRIGEAWKQPPPQQSALAFLIKSDAPIKDVAAALLHQYEPRRPGKPGGPHLRWQRPHYLVAWLVERYQDDSLRLSDDGMAMAAMTDICLSPAGIEWSTDELITHWINVINGWAFMRGRPPLDAGPGSRDHERVRTLLRGSKCRRL